MFITFIILDVSLLTTILVKIIPIDPNFLGSLMGPQGSLPGDQHPPADPWGVENTLLFGSLNHLIWKAQCFLTMCYVSQPHSSCHLESRPTYNDHVSVHVNTKSVPLTDTLLVFTCTALWWCYFGFLIFICHYHVF